MIKISTTVEIENLVKIFYDKKRKKEVHAINGISLKLKSGEIFGFLGPNGAGKTTTIRVLAGLLKPTSGQASIFGRNVVEMGDRIRKNIGFLTETHGNYENLSVYDNLKFFGSFFEIENIEKRIDEILEILEISDRKLMKVGKLSKGLKQRAALARVLLHDPKLIFLDEPTAGLDPTAAANVREIIKKLRSKDKIIFINSHNLEEVQKICDRVAILNQGKIMRIGTSEELSKEIFGAQELEILIRNGIPQEVSEIIEKNSFVEHVRIESSKIFVHLQDLDVNTPTIIEQLVERDIKILEVKRSSHSLEEIYLTLMSEPEKIEKMEGKN